MSPIPNFDEETTDCNLSTINRVTNVFFNGEMTLVENMNDTTDSIPEVAMEQSDEGFNASASKLENIGKYEKVSVLEGECSESQENLDSKSSSKMNCSMQRVDSVNVINVGENDNNFVTDECAEVLSDARVSSSMTQIANIDPDTCGMPLNLFQKVFTFFVKRNMRN